MFYSWNPQNEIRIKVETKEIVVTLDEDGELYFNNIFVGEIDELSELGKVIFPTRYYSLRHFLRGEGFTSEYLSPGCENLHEVLSLQPKTREFLFEFLQSYSLFLSVNEKHFSIVDRGKNVWPELIAEGIKKSIYMLAAILSNDVYAQKHNEKCILAIEEPDAGLHPALIKKIVEVIEQSKNIFVISTHNPFSLSYFINSKLREDELKIFGVKKKEEGTILREISLQKAGELLMDSQEILEDWDRLVE